MAEYRSVEANVIFRGMTTFSYLLNIASYNNLTFQFQVVPRFFMSRLTAGTYKLTIGDSFSITSNLYPEFNHGAEVKGWILDFSSAQHQGLAKIIGEKATEVIRGCEVHFMRAVKKSQTRFRRMIAQKMFLRKLLIIFRD